MGAQVDRGQASKQMQLAAAGRARRADAIGRRGDDSENVEEGGEVFMGGNPNFDESAPGQGSFGPGILGGGVNQRPTMSAEQLGNALSNKGNYAEFLAQLAQRRKGAN